MTRMFNPPHPGEVLQDTVLSAGGLSVTEFAKRLGVSRVALSRVVNGHAAVSAELAIRLAAIRAAASSAPGSSDSTRPSSKICCRWTIACEGDHKS